MRPHSSPDSLSSISSTISTTNTLATTKSHRASAPGNLSRKHQNQYGLNEKPSFPHPSVARSDPPSSSVSSSNSAGSSEQSVPHKIDGISGKESSMSNSARNKKLKKGHGCLPLDFGYLNVYASDGAGKRVIAGDSAAACCLM